MFPFPVFVQERMGCARLKPKRLELGTVPLKVGVDLGTMSKVVSDCAVNLLKREAGKVIDDAFRRKAGEKVIDNRIQRNPGTGNSISVLSMFDVRFAQSSDLRVDCK